MEVEKARRLVELKASAEVEGVKRSDEQMDSEWDGGEI